MAKKQKLDFTAVGDGVKRQLAEFTGQPVEQKAEEEKKQPKEEKGKRINLLLTEKNHKFIYTMAKATGQNMTSFINQIIEIHQEDYPGELERAQSFIDSLAAGCGRYMLKDPKEE